MSKRKRKSTNYTSSARKRDLSRFSRMPPKQEVRMVRQVQRQMKQMYEAAEDYFDFDALISGVTAAGHYLAPTLTGGIVRSDGSQAHGARFGQKLKPLKLSLRIATHINDTNVTPSAVQDLIIPEMYCILGCTVNGNVASGTLTAPLILSTLYDSNSHSDFSIAFRNLHQNEFRVLKKWRIPVAKWVQMSTHESTGTTAAHQTFYSLHEISEFYYDFPQNFYVEYNSGSAGDETDVDHNNLWLIVFNSNPNAGSGEPSLNIRATARIRYLP